VNRVPAAAWLCALVACVNAVCWSLITPPFEVPDEPSHVAYVKQLAETGSLPTTSKGSFSPEESIALRDLRVQTVAERPENQPISTRAQENDLQRDLLRAKRSPVRGSSYADVATAQPPLYYALEVIPYRLGASGTLLDRIELMRLLSALMAGLTGLFGFLFIREALPGSPQAQVAGGVCVALVPLLGFMSGAVNPDAMLYAVTAALLFALARSFCRGLSRRRAIALGGLTAVGLATKLNFVGIAPGVLLGLLLLTVRQARTQGRSAYLSGALGLAIALVPALAYVGVHLGAGGKAFGVVSSAVATTGGSAAGELSYVWQMYLPALPGMHVDFAGVSTTRQIWFDWYVGLYGWLDTTFPSWVYELALVPAALIAALCLRGLLVARGALRGRAGELVVYLAMLVGLMLLIGADSYRSFPRVDAEFGQVRYLLPMIPLLGAAVALAVRGAGRRWAVPVGGAMIVLFLAHDVFSQLQTVARFYG